MLSIYVLGASSTGSGVSRSFPMASREGREDAGKVGRLGGSGQLLVGA